MYMRGSDVPPTRCYAISSKQKPEETEKQLQNTESEIKYIQKLTETQ